MKVKVRKMNLPSIMSLDIFYYSNPHKSKMLNFMISNMTPKNYSREIRKSGENVFDLEKFSTLQIILFQVRLTFVILQNFNTVKLNIKDNIYF